MFLENRKDRERSKFLDKYEGIGLDDFDVATVRGREVLRCHTGRFICYYGGFCRKIKTKLFRKP